MQDLSITILSRSKNHFGSGDRLGHLEVGQAELKAKADGIEKQFKLKVDGIEKEVTELKESVKEIKKSQTSQIWALIVAVFVAVIGLIGTLIVGFVIILFFHQSLKIEFPRVEKLEKLLLAAFSSPHN